MRTARKKPTAPIPRLSRRPDVGMAGFSSGPRSGSRCAGAGLGETAAWDGASGRGPCRPRGDAGARAPHREEATGAGAGRGLAQRRSS
jgi:hypothetical protein